MKRLSISVIIPTLNEQENIETLISYLHRLDSALELIIADAGSVDRTVEKARNLSKVIHSARGRGVQMNEGAKAATGDILWFIHADCRPHPASIDAMAQALANENIIGGAFEYRLNQPGFKFRLAENLSNYKNRLLVFF